MTLAAGVAIVLGRGGAREGTREERRAVLGERKEVCVRRERVEERERVGDSRGEERKGKVGWGII